MPRDRRRLHPATRRFWGSARYYEISWRYRTSESEMSWIPYPHKILAHFEWFSLALALRYEPSSIHLERTLC